MGRSSGPLRTRSNIDVYTNIFPEQSMPIDKQLWQFLVHNLCTSQPIMVRALGSMLSEPTVSGVTLVITVLVWLISLLYTHV
jgi:hypothetical protein